MFKTIRQPRDARDLLETTNLVYHAILKHNPPKNLKIAVATLPYKFSDKKAQRAVMMRLESDLDISSWRSMEDFSNKDLTIRNDDSHEEKLRKYFSRKTPRNLLREGDIVILVDKRMAHVVNEEYAKALVAAAYCQAEEVPLIGGNMLLTIKSVAAKKVIMTPKNIEKYVKKVAKTFFKDDSKAVSFGEEEDAIDEIDESELEALEAEMAEITTNESHEIADAPSVAFVETEVVTEEQPATTEVETEPEQVDDYLRNLIDDLRSVVPHPTAEDLVNYVAQKILERNAAVAVTTEEKSTAEAKPNLSFYPN